MYFPEPKLPAKVLEYLYTGKAATLGKYTAELLCARDKYEVAGLGKRCDSHLEASITPANAMDILQLADRHHLTDPKKNVMMVIMSDKNSFLANKDSAGRGACH